MSFTLERIVLREVALTLVEPFRISSGVTHERRILLVEVVDAEGARGWGECVAGEQPTYSPETIDTAWTAIESWVAPRLLGRSFDAPSEVWPVLQPGFRGHLMAKGAVEMACWELAARREGVALAKLLGGERDRVATGISIGIQEEPAALVTRAAAAAEAGYRKIKAKIQPGADLRFVEAVREALGPEVPLMADANSAYRLADADRLRRLDDFDLLMIEQPLGREDLVRHARLQAQITTPICLDESITSRDSAEDMIELGSGRIVNIKPGRVGGFAVSLAIHEICRQAGVPVWCGGMLESGVGRGHNVALASLPGFTLPGDLSPSARYWKRDLVDEEWTMSPDGYVEIRWDRPGLGAEVDRDRLARITARTTELRA